jgi:HlyD family secretion protein
MSDAPSSAPTPPTPRAPSREAIDLAARRQSTRRWARRIVTMLVLLALVAIFVLALQPQPAAVDVATVDRGPIEVTVDEPGRTRVLDRYTVSAPLAGNLGRLALHASDTVSEGQVVARIVPLAPPLLDARTRIEADARLDEARARRDQARFSITHARELADFAARELARQQQLTAAGASPPRALEQAEVEARSRASEVTSLEFALRVAQHEVEVAEATLGRLDPHAPAAADAIELTAPVAGVVLHVVRESAGVVQPAEPILEIGDPSALEIVTDVLTSDAVHVAPGAEVRIDGWGGEPLEGRVRLVEPSATTRVSALGVQEQRVDVIIALTSERARWASLGDGYRVETHVVVDRREGALRVPASAVFRTGDGWSAYVVEGDHARHVSVELGLRSRDAVEVLGGLAEGQRVIVYPGERVVDGALVSVRP